MPPNIAVISGVGSGTGAAVARAFAAKGFSVALLSRNSANLKPFVESIRTAGGTAEAFTADLSSTEALTAAFAGIKKIWPQGKLKVAIYNGWGGFFMKPFLDTQESDLRRNLDNGVVGGFTFAKLAITAFKEHGEGSTLIFTGATAALRGGANFSVFATAAFGLRALTQSLAREFHPQGIHVCHVIIDGKIDTERIRSIMPSDSSKDNGGRLDPEEIAKAYIYLHEQAPSTWTQELDLRPAHERGQISHPVL